MGNLAASEVMASAGPWVSGEVFSPSYMREFRVIP